MKARVTYVGSDTSEIIELEGHEFQCGGAGDGFCYGHQSFDCMDNLTETERTALHEAE